MIYDTERLQKQIEFVIEIDKLKNIYRQTYVLGEERKENDSEHSWHIALMAFLLAEYSEKTIDVLKTMKMLLIHDIVEIDAGDTYCYDAEGYKTKAEREEKAAQRIFGLLPENQCSELYALWREFEDGSSDEAKFAAVLDRIQPLILNYTKNGISWKEHDVCKEQVAGRYSQTAEASEKLTQLAMNIINDAHEKGWLK
ncbi:MAG: HD domain-containing protein [Oscillospiraceae bacterium]|nr:HD domain-containing protein [Oscillospiraceae bacterium]